MLDWRIKDPSKGTISKPIGERQVRRILAQNGSDDYLVQQGDGPWLSAAVARKALDDLAVNGYYICDVTGMVEGPFTSDHFHDLVANERLPADIIAKQGRDGKWVTLSKLRESDAGGSHRRRLRPIAAIVLVSLSILGIVVLARFQWGRESEREQESSRTTDAQRVPETSRPVERSSQTVAPQASPPSPPILEAIDIPMVANDDASPHSDQVDRLVFSDSGRFLASRSRSELVLWDFESRRAVSHHKANGNVVDLRFSPNNRVLAEVTRNRRSDYPELRFWNLSDNTLITMRKLPKLPYQNVINSPSPFVFYNKAPLSAVLNSDGRLEIIDLVSGTGRYMPDRVDTSEDALRYSLQIARNDSVLCAHGFGSAVKVWHLSAQPVVVSNLSAQIKQPKACAVSPTGSGVLICGNVTEHWNVREAGNPQLERQVEVSNRYASANLALADHPNGQGLVMQRESHFAYFDWSTGQLSQVSTASSRNSSFAYGLGMVFDGCELQSISNGMLLGISKQRDGTFLYLFDAVNNLLLKDSVRLPGGSKRLEFSLSPNLKQIAYVTGRHVRAMERSEPPPVISSHLVLRQEAGSSKNRGIGISPTGNAIVLDENELWVWKSDSGELLYSDAINRQLLSGYEGILANDASKSFGIGVPRENRDRVVCNWLNVDIPVEQGVGYFHRDSIPIACSRQFGVIYRKASVDKQKHYSISIWPLIESGKVNLNFKQLFNSPVNRSSNPIAEISPDGSKLAVFADNELRVLSIPDGATLLKTEAPTEEIQWSKDGNLLATRASSASRVWNVLDFTKQPRFYDQPVLPLPKHQVVSRGGRNSTTLAKWDNKTGRRLEDALLDFDSTQSQLIPGPTGPTIAMIAGNSIFVVDPASGETKSILACFTPQSLQSGIQAVAFSHDGKLALVLGENGMVVLCRTGI